MGQTLDRFEEEIKNANTLGDSLVKRGQITSYEVDANSFTGEVELNAYYIVPKPITHINVDLVLKK